MYVAMREVGAKLQTADRKYFDYIIFQSNILMKVQMVYEFKLEFSIFKPCPVKYKLFINFCAAKQITVEFV